MGFNAHKRWKPSLKEAKTAPHNPQFYNPWPDANPRTRDVPGCAVPGSVGKDRHYAVDIMDHWAKKGRPFDA